MTKKTQRLYCIIMRSKTFIFKTFILLFLMIALTTFINIPDSHAADFTLNDSQTQVCFSPGGGCTEEIVDQIDNAKSEILIQAYSFTSAPIAKALVNAHKKGIHVEIILDKSNKSKKYSAGDFTAHMGVATYIDSKHAIAHNKIIIIDKETVITGSFNFTKAAEEKNAENLLIIRNKKLAEIYIDNWNMHKNHSNPYLGR
jgi:phosphatidylserine/phosphatidylglycerophosphate/cardiolipin synthase-like enzyme